MPTKPEREPKHLRVSLVATVLNEYGSLPGWVTGLNRQTRLPDDCIIVDGGSDDGTFEALLCASQDLPFPVRVLSLPGAGISAGRNAAMAEATGDVVVVTDAGTIAAPEWLERLVEPLESDSGVDIAAGFFIGVAQDVWGRALAAATLPDAGEVDPTRFLPSSRSVAFRRRWFDGGFAYPEWLDYCEDVVLDLLLRRGGARQVFVPRALVEFRPRSGPRAYFRQYYRYARGDGKAGLFAKRHVIRYLTYSSAAAVIIRKRRVEMLAIALLGVVYIRPCLRRYFRWFGGRDMSTRSATAAAALIAAQRLIGDVAKMAGYPVGLIWRIRRDGTFKLWLTGWPNRDAAGDLRRF